MSNLHLVVSTQYRENYGAHDWDGVGSCPQYWKNKGGSDYEIAVLDVQEVLALGSEGLKKRVNSLCESFGLVVNDDYQEQYIIDWELLEEGQPTSEEAYWAREEEEGVPDCFKRRVVWQEAA